MQEQQGTEQPKYTFDEIADRTLRYLEELGVDEVLKQRARENRLQMRALFEQRGETVPAFLDRDLDRKLDGLSMLFRLGITGYYDISYWRSLPDLARNCFNYLRKRFGELGVELESTPLYNDRVNSESWGTLSLREIEERLKQSERPTENPIVQQPVERHYRGHVQ